MILTCPACHSRFKVEDDAIGGSGRRVRCGYCAHEWTQLPAEAAHPPQPTPADEARPRLATTFPPGSAGAAEPEVREEAARVDSTPDAAAERVLEQPERRHPDAEAKGMGAGVKTVLWLIIVMIVIGAGAFGWYARERIVQRMPELQGAYEALGIEVNAIGAGLDLVNVISFRRDNIDPPVLVVEGEIMNTTSKPRAVPPLRARMLDATGAELTTWIFEAEETEVEPGERVAFQTRALNPPPEAADVGVTFADPAELP